jgi:hypothetical protein
MKMAILGLTHDQSGSVLETLPVSIKVAIGDISESGTNSHPVPLDHFVFKRRVRQGRDVCWKAAPDIACLFGEKPTEIGVAFLSDDMEKVLRTELAWWTQSVCKCRGQLVQIGEPDDAQFAMRAIRKTGRHPEGELWPGTYKYAAGPKKGLPVEPCGDGCPDLEEGRCKPSADLYFLLEKFPVQGSVCRLHTSSWRSVRNLSSGLERIRRINGGRLVSVTAVLRATPELTWYSDDTGKRHRKVIYVLSLESTTSTTTRTVRFAETEAAEERGKGDGAPAFETEAERAMELAAEFYSNSASAEACALYNCENEPGDIRGTRIAELATRLGYNHAKTQMLLGQYSGKLDVLEQKLTTLLSTAPPDDDSRAAE